MDITISDLAVSSQLSADNYYRVIDGHPMLLMVKARYGKSFPRGDLGMVHKSVTLIIPRNESSRDLL